jgi:hypothetical protein
MYARARVYACTSRGHVCRGGDHGCIGEQYFQASETNNQGKDTRACENIPAKYLFVSFGGIEQSSCSMSRCMHVHTCITHLYDTHVCTRILLVEHGILLYSGGFGQGSRNVEILNMPERPSQRNGSIMLEYSGTHMHRTHVCFGILHRYAYMHLTQFVESGIHAHCFHKHGISGQQECLLAHRNLNVEEHQPRHRFQSLSF